MAKANKRPVPAKHDSRVFIGTCSNCRTKEIDVTKVGGAQVCLEKCLSGVSYPEPKATDDSIQETAG
jgi:hypothetical protein